MRALFRMNGYRMMGWMALWIVIALGAAATMRWMNSPQYEHWKAERKLRQEREEWENTWTYKTSVLLRELSQKGCEPERDSSDQIYRRYCGPHASWFALNYPQELQEELLREMNHEHIGFAKLGMTMKDIETLVQAAKIKILGQYLEELRSRRGNLIPADLEKLDSLCRHAPELYAAALPNGPVAGELQALERSARGQTKFCTEE